MCVEDAGAYAVFECSADNKQVTRSAYSDGACTNFTGTAKASSEQCGPNRGQKSGSYGSWKCKTNMATLSLLV